MKAKVTFGNMLCLPGRVMHCGPGVMKEKSPIMRAVRFFTATPVDAKEQAYDSETQYCRSTLIHDILVHSWTALDTKEKQYMLRKWTMVGLKMDSIGAIQQNMQHKHLIVIALALKTRAGRKLEELISRIANDPDWGKEDWVQRWDDVNSQVYTIPKK